MTNFQLTRTKIFALMEKMSMPLSKYFLILGIFIVAIAATRWLKTEDAILKSLHELLSSLSEEQRGAIMFDHDDAKRTDWHYLPVASYDREGISLAELDDKQDQLVYNFLKASLSAEGYGKAENIIMLEDVLKVLEKDNSSRDREQYHMAIFGTPGKKGVWGVCFEGHHLSLNYTFVDGVPSAAPTFLGANPAEVPSGPHKGLRVLQDEEDLGIKLINALTSEQQQRALISDVAPREIFTANDSEVAPLENKGVTYAEMSAENRMILDDIIREYVSVMPEDIGRMRMKKIEAGGRDEIRFAWAGPKDRSAGHYYRVQGPSFLIEFDNTQNDANHIHTVWRDFKGDFGRDMIREHYHSAGKDHDHR